MNSHTASNTSYVNTLMVHYCLDLDGRSARSWINQWLDSHSIDWITLAVIEALYLGRYKAISVEYILQNWKRRGHPYPHFTKEFERVISRRFPRNLRELAARRTELVTPAVPQSNLDDLEIQDPGIRAILQDYLDQQTSISYDLKTTPQQGLISEPLHWVESLQPSEDDPTNALTEPDENATQEVQPQSRLASRWIAKPNALQLPLLKAEPIVQFVPEPTQANVLERLKTISNASLARGTTFTLIKSLMAQPL
jgi:hypothetical protein